MRLLRLIALCLGLFYLPCYTTGPADQPTGATTVQNMVPESKSDEITVKINSHGEELLFSYSAGKQTISVEIKHSMIDTKSYLIMVHNATCWMLTVLAILFWIWLRHTDQNPPADIFCDPVEPDMDDDLEPSPRNANPNPAWPMPPDYPDSNDTSCSSLPSNYVRLNGVITNHNNSSDSHEAIDYVNVDIGHEFGRGAYGKVHRGRLVMKNGERKNVVVKFPHGTQDKHQRWFQQELNMMKCVGHHINVLTLLASVKWRESLGGVLEFCELGSVKSYVHSKRDMFKIFNPSSKLQTAITYFIKYAKTATKLGYASPFEDSITELDLLFFAFQIANGLAHLASKKLLHGDVALRNTLLTDRFLVKICDFGLAQRLDHNTGGHEMRLPFKWMAPEAMEGNFGTNSDQWSFGVTLYELFSLGAEPYSGFTRSRLRRFLDNGERLNPPDHCPNAVSQLMRQCWSMNKQDRPSFEECKNILMGSARSVDTNVWDEAMQYFEIMTPMADDIDIE